MLLPWKFLKLYTLRLLLRPIFGQKHACTILSVCSLHVHMKAIAHANNWSLTLAFHIIFTRTLVNLTCARLLQRHSYLQFAQIPQSSFSRQPIHFSQRDRLFLLGFLGSLAPLASSCGLVRFLPWPEYRERVSGMAFKWSVIYCHSIWPWSH